MVVFLVVFLRLVYNPGDFVACEFLSMPRSFPSPFYPSGRCFGSFRSFRSMRVKTVREGVFSFSNDLSSFTYLSISSNKRNNERSIYAPLPPAFHSHFLFLLLFFSFVRSCISKRSQINTCDVTCARASPRWATISAPFSRRTLAPPARRGVERRVGWDDRRLW